MLMTTPTHKHTRICHSSRVAGLWRDFYANWEFAERKPAIFNAMKTHTQKTLISRPLSYMT